MTKQMQRTLSPLVAGLVSILIASTAMADLLKLEAGKDKLEGVSLATSATTAQNRKLSFVGAGLRAKKVIMVNVNVYVAQLFVADAGKFKKSESEALNSLTAAQPVALQLHFLRDVDAKKVHTSFKEALEANKVDVKKPEIQSVLEAVSQGGEAKKGKTLTLLGVKNPDGTETINYEDANLKTNTVSGPSGFIKDVFSIWLGQPSDDGVARLKASLLH
jgi:hypothetical protein